MSSAIDGGTLRCPRCTYPLAYRFAANDGGGLRYDVSCAPCGEVYFEFCVPLIEQPATA